jgi:hypothetical protein
LLHSPPFKEEFLGIAHPEVQVVAQFRKKVELIFRPEGNALFDILDADDICSLILRTANVLAQGFQKTNSEFH